MPPNTYCHFCGRSDSLNSIPDSRKKVCSICWEIIAYIASKWYEAGAKVLPEKFDDHSN